MITMNASMRLHSSLSRLSSSVLGLTFPSIVMEGGEHEYTRNFTTGNR